MEHGYRVLDSRFGGHALDRLDDDTFRLTVGCQLGVIHNVVYIRLGLRLRLLFERLHQTFFRFFCRKSGNGFQFFTLLRLHHVELFFLLLDDAELCIQILLDGLRFIPLALKLLVLLVKHHFTLLQLVFRLLDFLVTGSHLFFQVSLLVKELLLHLQKFVLFNHLGFSFSLLNYRFTLRLQAVPEESV